MRIHQSAPPLKREATLLKMNPRFSWVSTIISSYMFNSIFTMLLNLHTKYIYIKLSILGWAAFTGTLKFPWISSLFPQAIYSVSPTKTEHTVPAVPHYTSNAPLHAPNKSIFVILQKGICHLETKIHKTLNFLNPVQSLFKLHFGQSHRGMHTYKNRPWK